MKKYFLTISMFLGLAALIMPVVPAMCQEAPTITATVGANGTVSYNGQNVTNGQVITVTAGSSPTFTFTPTPNTDYTPELTVDGAAVALTGSTYTFTNVTASHTLIATFIECIDPTTQAPLTASACSQNYATYVSNVGSNLTNNIIAPYSSLPKAPIYFATNMNFAYGGTIAEGNITIAMLETYAFALHNQGIYRIDMNPTLTIYQNSDAMSKYAALFSYIHSLGMIVSLNPEYNTQNDYPTIQNLTEYQTQALADYLAFAALNPDNLTAVHEPTTQLGRMSLATGQPITIPGQTTPATTQQLETWWNSFINTTGAAIKVISPMTKIGAGIFVGGAVELPYFECWTMPSTCPDATPANLDYLTFDVYQANASAISTMNTLVADAKTAGKPLYMEETWLQSFVPSDYNPVSGESAQSNAYVPYYYEGFTPLDGEWVNAMALFASTHGLTSMTTFNSDIFFAYANTAPYALNNYFTQFVEPAIGPPTQTTPMYSSYQADVAEYQVPHLPIYLSSYITAGTESDGSINPSGLEIPVDYGTTMTFTATPKPGYTPQLSVDGLGASWTPLNNNPYTYTLSDMIVSHTLAVTFSPITETITASVSGKNGTISPLGDVSVNLGANQTFTLTPNTGYVGQITVDNNPTVITANTYTFTDVTAPHTISASFILQAETITATEGTGGSITPSGPVSVNYGKNQVFTVLANPGSNINQVLVDGVVQTLNYPNQFGYNFQNVTENHTISATFTSQTYTITVMPEGNGSISGPTTVDYDATPTYTIKPNTGYQISSVTVDGNTVPNVASYQFPPVTSNQSIRATFAPITYTITATPGAGGTISNGGQNVSGPLTFNSGSKPTFQIASNTNTGYTINEVQVDGVSQPLNYPNNTSYTFTPLAGNHTISANFVLESETINSSAGANGTLSPLGATAVTYGGSQTYTIKPGAGYQISSVTVNGTVLTGTPSTYTFNNVITNNQSIRATFAPITYTITATPGAGGTISNGGQNVSGPLTFNSGSKPTFQIASNTNTGYTINEVQVDGVSQPLNYPNNTSYTFTPLAGNHTISATFELQTFKITASAGNNGSVSCPSTAVYNTQPTCTITANPGYQISTLTVDGNTVPNTSNYTFSPVTANQSIRATFVKS